MRRYPSLMCSLVLAIAAAAVAQARDIEMGGDSNYPYSIMAPEPETAGHHRATTSGRTPRASRAAKPFVRPSTPRNYRAARGSSGVVLPTPLPRTELIPPEGDSAPMLRTPGQQQGHIVLPGPNPIPNLPHGTETFQDRASRCAQQQALYNVPAGASALYMHTCAM